MKSYNITFMSYLPHLSHIYFTSYPDESVIDRRRKPWYVHSSWIPASPLKNLDRFSHPWIPAYSATNHRPRTAHKLKWYDLTHALNMWPSYVKNHSTLGRRLVSFIFIEKFGLYELGPSMIQVLIDQFYSFIKTYAIIKI